MTKVPLIGNNSNGRNPFQNGVYSSTSTNGGNLMTQANKAGTDRELDSPQRVVTEYKYVTRRMGP